MSRDCEHLYLERKLGKGMGVKYTLSSFTPLLLVMIITAILVFSLVFIFSMSSAIDRMIALLGSGSISSEDYIDPSLLPLNSTQDKVFNGEGIFYSEDSESITYLKGVDSSYFNSERISGLRVDIKEEKKNWAVLSSTLAKSLNVDIGDKMTLLLYENEKGRIRPFLINIIGIFDSGYAQLDRYMAFVDESILSGNSCQYEIILPASVDVESLQEALYQEGYFTRSYKENNAILYSNVEQSIWILYVIIVLIAVLSAFFSIEVSLIYLSRDRSDIATLTLLGLSRKRIMAIYLKMTLIQLSISTLLGVALGLLLGLLSPQLVSIISYFEPRMLEYYITSFSIKIPYSKMVIMVLMMILFAYISLLITLKRREKSEIIENINTL